MAGTGLEAVGSGRQMDREWARDEAVLSWVVRFRFVTVGALALRWEVSEQQMRARVRRLEREGLLRRDRRSTNAPAAITPTNRALIRLGLSVRRTPRFDGRIGHEVAIIKRVTAAEAHFRRQDQPEALVLTEREIRRAEAAGTRRYSVEVLNPHYERRRRWPDYVVETDGGRTAVELEFSPKTTHRLRSIVRGYLDSQHYDFVDFILLPGRENAALRERLSAIVEEERLAGGVYQLLGLEAPSGLRLVTWLDPYPALHAGIAPFPSIATV
jgi:DNA-binding Lrp family transcriptional regulator